MNRTIAQMSSRRATAGNTTRKFISGTYNQDTKASQQTAVNKEQPRRLSGSLLETISRVFD
jgi:hypothetical protein